MDPNRLRRGNARKSILRKKLTAQKQWKNAPKTIERYYRNVTSMSTENGTYEFDGNIEPVFQYLDKKDNIIGNNIYKYIHLSKTFQYLQTKVLGLHKGVLTYLNPNNGRYEYLYGGEADFLIDKKLDRKNSILPSFLIKHYAYLGNGQWEDIDREDERRPLFRCYNRLQHGIREKQIWRRSSIVKFFNFKIKGKNIIQSSEETKVIEEHSPLTHFQIKNQVVVVSSGEIDVKILASILIDQRVQIAEQMAGGKPLMECNVTPPKVVVRNARPNVNKQPNAFKELSFEEQRPEGNRKFTLRSKRIFSFEDPDFFLKDYLSLSDYGKSISEAKIPQSDAILITELLTQFGVIKLDNTLTERGYRIGQWLQALKKNGVYNVLFEKSTPRSVYENIYDKYNFEKNNIASYIEFIWDWINLKSHTGYLLESFEQFQNSTICMIDIRTQYFTRLIRIGGKDVPGNTASVGWIVFPVLPTSRVFNYQMQLKSKVTGLFVGNFRDVDQHGKGYIEEGVLTSRWDETDHKYDESDFTKSFKALVTRLKMVIHPLAQIENAEVIHKRIAQQKIDYEANKSIIANIFIRNIAHNLGTHVTPRVENSLLYEQFGVHLDRLNALLQEPGDAYSRVEDCFKRIKYINSLKKILENYLNERQEFISDISPESFPMNSKCYFYRDIVLPFVENMLLTANIARSEGVGFDTIGANCSLQIRVYRNFNKADEDTGQKIGYELKAMYPIDDETVYYYPNIEQGENFPFYIDLPSQSSMTYEDFLQNKEIRAVSLADQNKEAINDQDVMIAIPSHLGRHAFYSILENIIRNSAKNHIDVIQKRCAPTSKMTIHISVDDPKYSSQGRLVKLRNSFSLDEYYSIRIWDDVTTFTSGEYKEIKDWKRERNFNMLYERTNVKPPVKLSSRSRFFTTFDDRIKNSAPKDQNEAKAVTLGLDDIRVSALILGGGMTKFGEEAFSVSKLEHRYLHISDRVDDDNLFFVYVFRLAKPKTFLFCTTNFPKNTHDCIMVVDQPASFNGQAKCDFCLVNGQDLNTEKLCKELIAEHSYTLPNRIIVYNVITDSQKQLLRQLGLSYTDENLQDADYTINSRNNPDSIERLTRRCWKIWLARWTTTDSGNEQPVYLYTNNDTGDPFSISFDGLVHWRNVPEPTQDTQLIRRGGSNLIYSRHNLLYTNDVRQQLIQSDNHCFYQNIDKNSLDFSRIHHLPTDKFGQELLAYRLAEAGLFRILILDERVAETVAAGNVNDFEQYKNQNVFICTSLTVKDKDIAMLSSKDSDKGVHVSVSDTHSLCIDGSPLPVRFDAILIHRTKLKQMKDELGVTDAAIVDLLRKSFQLLVINTGGGGKGVLGYKANYFQHTLTMKFFHQTLFAKVAFTEKIVG